METYTKCATSGYGAEFHINAIDMSLGVEEAF